MEKKNGQNPVDAQTMDVNTRVLNLAHSQRSSSSKRRCMEFLSDCVQESQVLPQQQTNKDISTSKQDTAKHKVLQQSLGSTYSLINSSQICI